MKFPAAANARCNSTTCSGQLRTAAEGTGLPSDQLSEGTHMPFQHTSQGKQLPSEHLIEGTGLRMPSDGLHEGSQLPSKHCIEGTGLPFEHPSKGTGLPSEHRCEGSQIPFVHWLLSLHMDKVQQGQLVQAWLSAGRGPLLCSWQTFLGPCDHAQVMRNKTAVCACSVIVYL